MISATGNFALRQLGMGWVTSPDRMGHIAYMGASKMITMPLEFLIGEAAKGVLPEKPAVDENPSFLLQLGIKPIKTRDELIEKVFWVAVSIALIIPVAIMAKEVVIYLGYQQLSMVATPLLTLFKEEVANILISEIAFAFIALALDSSKEMA